MPRIKIGEPTTELPGLRRVRPAPAWRTRIVKACQRNPGLFVPVVCETASKARTVKQIIVSGESATFPAGLWRAHVRGNTVYVCTTEGGATK